MIRIVVSAALILGPMFYFGIATDVDKMGIAAAAGAAAAMLLHLDRLKSLKLGIMEAQLKEKIEQATATLEAFQDLAAETLAFNVDRITNAMRAAGKDEVQKRDARVVELRDVAKRMGVLGDRRIVAAVEQHHRMMAFDLYAKIGSSYQYECETQIALRQLAANRTHLPSREEIMVAFAEPMRPQTGPEIDEYVAYCERHAMHMG